MTTLREAAQQALEALHNSNSIFHSTDAIGEAVREMNSKAMEALRAALEAPKANSKGKFMMVPTELTDEMLAVYQTAFMSQDRFDVHKVWAKMLDAAPKVEPLTDDAIREIYANTPNGAVSSTPGFVDFARAIEKRVRG